MGTEVTLRVVSDSEKKAYAAYKMVVDEFERVEKIMSSWKSGSDVAKLNQAKANRWVKVNAEVFRLLVLSDKYSRLTSGAFDVTVGGFRGLWKFDQDKDGTIPTASQVKRRLSIIGYQKLKLDKKMGRAKKLKPGVKITLGGIAKGYALERSVELLHKAGFKNFILQAGGDLFASGDKMGRPWRVGVRDPRGKAGDVFAAMPLSDKTFSTSGDYERYVIRDGRRYHHILDPLTGFPAVGARSVTVWADSPMIADVWSTALFVLGPEKGLPLLKGQSVEAVFVTTDGKVVTTQGLKTVLKTIAPLKNGI